MKLGWKDKVSSKNFISYVSRSFERHVWVCDGNEGVSCLGNNYSFDVSTVDNRVEEMEK
jgi:hypothetical protein